MGVLQQCDATKLVPKTKGHQTCAYDMGHHGPHGWQDAVEFESAQPTRHESEWVCLDDCIFRRAEFDYAAPHGTEVMSIVLIDGRAFTTRATTEQIKAAVFGADNE